MNIVNVIAVIVTLGFSAYFAFEFLLLCQNVARIRALLEKQEQMRKQSS